MNARLRLFYIFIISTCTGVAPSTRAGELEQWLASIDDYSPTVISARGRWEAAKAMTDGTGSWADPMLEFEFERDDTRLEDYETLTYAIAQELPWPGRNGVLREVARLDAEATGFDMLEIRRQVRADITGAFWNLWATRESARLLSEQKRITENLVAATRAGMESGQMPQAAWLRVEIERDQLDNEIVTMQREIDAALARLNGLLNAPPDTPRSTGELPALPALETSVEQLQADARKYCCILMATLWRQMARDLDRQSASLEQRPAFNLRVAAMQSRERGDIASIDTGIALNLPWIWNGKYRGMRAAAEAEYLEASAMLEEETAMTLTEIQELYNQAEARLRTMRLYEEQLLPRARVLAETSRESYASGAMTAMEMLDAQNMLIEAELNHAREKAAYATAHARLMAVAQPWSADEVKTGLPLHLGE